MGRGMRYEGLILPESDVGILHAQGGYHARQLRSAVSAHRQYNSVEPEGRGVLSAREQRGNIQLDVTWGSPTRPTGDDGLKYEVVFSAIIPCHHGIQQPACRRAWGGGWMGGHTTYFI